MNADWPIVQLGEHCLKVGSGATPRGGASVYLDDGEVCLIRSQNVYNDGFKPEGLVYITEESASKLKNVIVESNDILLNITGDSVARVCLAHDSYLPARVNQHVAIIRPEPTSFDARYLRYLLVSPTMQRFLLTIAAVGATRNALTKGMIETLGVPKPPLELQRAIADKLDSLDNKIELNRQINQTLEQIAQAIFKSWFVDFEPTRAKIIAKEQGADPATQELAAQAIICGAITLEQLEELEQNLETTLQQAINEKLTQGNQTPANAEQLKATAALFPNELVESELGEIPSGWKCQALSGWGDIVCGKTPLKRKDEYYGGDVPFIKIPDMHGNMFATHTVDSLTSEGAASQPKKAIPKGSICVSCIATVGLVVIATEESHTNQQINSIVPENEAYTPYLYFRMQSLNRYLHELASGGSATLNLNTGNFSKIEVLKPSADILNRFHELTAPILDKILENTLGNQTLSELRDTLLPKLLSGELSVAETV